MVAAAERQRGGRHCNSVRRCVASGVIMASWESRSWLLESKSPTLYHGFRGGVNMNEGIILEARLFRNPQLIDDVIEARQQQALSW